MVTEKTVIRTLSALDSMGARAVAADELDDAATLGAARLLLRSLWTEVVTSRATAAPAGDAAAEGVSDAAPKDGAA